MSFKLAAPYAWLEFRVTCYLYLIMYDPQHLLRVFTVACVLAEMTCNQRQQKVTRLKGCSRLLQRNLSDV